MKKILIALAVSFCQIANSNAEVLRMPLEKFYGEKSINLKCTTSSRKISIPLPDRWEIRSATLVFSYTNSVSLIQEMSHLSFNINGKTLSQVRLDPMSPEGRVTVNIPSEKLKADYNDFEFQVFQHFQTGKQCELPCAPNLWTNIAVDQSYIEIDYSLKPVPLDLGATAFLFDPKMITDGRVNLVLEDFSPDTLTIAGITASGIAKKFNYRKVAFTVSGDLMPGVDNILIGKKEFAENLLNRYGVEFAVNSSFLKIMPLPFMDNGKPGADSKHALVLVTGPETKHVMIAAETMAIMNFPYPGTDQMEVHEFNLPNITLYSGKNMLQTEKVHKLGTLDYKTYTFRGFQGFPKIVSFMLPADFLIQPNKYAKLVLNFNYGAGMRADSVLNIVLNDTNVRSINLDKPTGDAINGYKVELPSYLLKPGSNTLAFNTFLTPTAKECDLVQPESLFLTLFDNSTIFLPEMPHLIELPRMELFTLNGFPFTRWPDGFGSYIYLTRNDPNTFQAALNIIGLISQKNGYPLLGLKVVLEKPKNEAAELIVLGDIASIPNEFLKAAPLKLTQVSEAPYPIVNNWESGKNSYAIIKQTSGLGPDKGAVMEFESPYLKGRTVLMFTALSSDNVGKLGEAFLDSSVHGRIEGNLAFVTLTPPDFKVSTLSYGKKYLTGRKGEISRLDVFLYEHPYLYYLIIVVLFLIIGTVLYLTARSFKAKRSVEPAAGTEEARKSTGRRIIDLLVKIFVRKQ